MSGPRPRSAEGSRIATTPPSDDPSNGSTPSTSTSTSPRRRLLIRIGAGIVAAALVATLAVLVLSGRETTRSAAAYCSRMSDTRDLGEVLATGDAGQIQAAVRQLQAAGKVAPSEIQPAMDLYVGYATKLSDAVQSSGKDEASIVAALKAAAIAQNEQADQVATAVTQVETYVTGTCDFSLTPSTTG